MTSQPVSLDDTDRDDTVVFHYADHRVYSASFMAVGGIFSYRPATYEARQMIDVYEDGGGAAQWVCSPSEGTFDVDEWVRYGVAFLDDGGMIC